MPTMRLLSLALVLLSCAPDGPAGALLISKGLQQHGRSKPAATPAAAAVATKTCAKPHPSFASQYGYSSSSPLFVGQANVDGGVAKGPPPSGKGVAPWLRTLAIFALGYGLGGASAPGWQRQSRLAKRIGFTQIALVVLVLRDLWRSTPDWLKPRIAGFGRRVVNWIRARFTKHATLTEAEMEDMDDISDFSNFATKIQNVINVAKTKLALEEDATNMDGFNVRASFFSLLQLLGQVKSRRPSARDQVYRSSGAPVPDELLEGMDHMFELADLAYDEHEDGDIKQVLRGMGYSLIKQDTTAIPGYLGYYVAINTDPSKEKTAIIGVKGTSNLEDLFTDSCASAVSYKLANTFYEGGGTSLRCHEGVFISSQRCLEDILPLVKNLLLPSGYKIILTGHSLGAGCASLLGVQLRASIKSLQDIDKLKVWAFASPPVLDVNSARGCSSFVTTVVNNCDVVTRSNISPLVVTVNMMRAVDKRLDENGLNMSDFQSTLAYLKKIREGTDGEMLLSADELISELENTIEREDVEDPDHLYVPGKVVLMYDLWEKEQRRGGIEEESEKDFAKFVKDWVPRLKDTNLQSKNVVELERSTSAEEAILCMDGTCKALQFIELDGRLIDDHMTPQYRSSIANILSTRNTLAEKVTAKE